MIHETAFPSIAAVTQTADDIEVAEAVTRVVGFADAVCPTLPSIVAVTQAADDVEVDAVVSSNVAGCANQLFSQETTWPSMVAVTS